MDPPTNPQLSLLNVLLALSFIIFDALLSVSFNLGIASSLLIAAGRCILQLSVMGLILDRVFAADNVWGVFGMILLLNVLGSIEATYNKSKRRFINMFPLILLSMITASTPIGILGTKYAMVEEPFWKPNQIVPVFGMLLGNGVSSVCVGMNYAIKELSENRDKIETYLAMGASRLEACQPIAREAAKLALLPTINQMSVVGLIAIPGMMTGALLAGQSVQQAARLQMVIMFMISASSALAVLLSLFFTLSTLTDTHHRIRLDRIDSTTPLIYRWRNEVAGWVWREGKGVWTKAMNGRTMNARGRGGGRGNGEMVEGERLLVEREEVELRAS